VSRVGAETHTTTTTTHSSSGARRGEYGPFILDFFDFYFYFPQHFAAAAAACCWLGWRWNHGLTDLLDLWTYAHVDPRLSAAHCKYSCIGQSCGKLSVRFMNGLCLKPATLYLFWILSSFFLVSLHCLSGAIKSFK